MPVVNIAIAIIVGTKNPDTVSAILAIGALVDTASATVFIILESAVFSPTSLDFAIT